MSDPQEQERAKEVARDTGMSDDARELLERLAKQNYLCWNGPKMEGAAHDLIMLGYAEGRRPARHRNWYIDITDAGRLVATYLGGDNG